MSRRTFALSLGLLAAVAAGSPRTDAADPPRPFRGTAVGVATPVSPTELIIDYTGTATHLGHFTRREWLTFTGPGTFTGTMVTVAANGDELWLDFDGAFTSPTTAEGTYTFTGGTGRFADATGTADFEAYTPDGVNVTATFDGAIRY
jgi:hypothetical protein